MFGRLSHWWRVRRWFFRTGGAFGGLALRMALEAGNGRRRWQLVRFGARVLVRAWVVGGLGRGQAVAL